MRGSRRDGNRHLLDRHLYVVGICAVQTELVCVASGERLAVLQIDVSVVVAIGAGANAKHSARRRYLICAAVAAIERLVPVVWRASELEVHVGRIEFGAYGECYLEDIGCHLWHTIYVVPLSARRVGRQTNAAVGSREPDSTLPRIGIVLFLVLPVFGVPYPVGQKRVAAKVCREFINSRGSPEHEVVIDRDCEEVGINIPSAEIGLASHGVRLSLGEVSGVRPAAKINLHRVGIDCQLQGKANK